MNLWKRDVSNGLSLSERILALPMLVPRCQRLVKDPKLEPICLFCPEVCGLREECVLPALLVGFASVEGL